jgi:hypothetical protein
VNKQRLALPTGIEPVFLERAEWRTQRGTTSAGFRPAIAARSARPPDRLASAPGYQPGSQAPSHGQILVSQKIANDKGVTARLTGVGSDRGAGRGS